ncbi:hypothetical protein C8R46DRAFT_1033127 [Mycena filopes]|nr:hypothetical protein C8R46DRAFT_1033127 [Mycena filopes]
MLMLDSNEPRSEPRLEDGREFTATEPSLGCPGLPNLHSFLRRVQARRGSNPVWILITGAPSNPSSTPHADAPDATKQLLLDIGSGSGRPSGAAAASIWIRMRARGAGATEPILGVFLSTMDLLDLNEQFNKHPGHLKMQGVATGPVYGRVSILSHWLCPRADLLQVTRYWRLVSDSRRLRLRNLLTPYILALYTHALGPASQLQNAQNFAQPQKAPSIGMTQAPIDAPESGKGRRSKIQLVYNFSLHGSDSSRTSGAGYLCI